PGVIFIEVIYHLRNASGPRVSELTKAVHENIFLLSSLHSIFFSDVVNFDTDHAARSSAEFHALLASRFGKMVSYLVPRACSQAVKRVARIINFHTQGYRRELSMHFDIENFRTFRFFNHGGF
ncbi:hypothetical protein N7508_006606, partial [Penicillium antarcticum]|uniref:uncharacterized protein n=1 Tax=Penicillium antarcticum TaxID=416450 RepID=UPI00238A984C